MNCRSANSTRRCLINIFTADAAVRENSDEEGELLPTKYIGMDRYEARKQIVADLEAEGLLEKTVDHKLMVPRGDRSGTVIEPFLTDPVVRQSRPAGKTRHRGGREW